MNEVFDIREAREIITAIRSQVAELQAKLDTAIDALDGANEGIARRQSQLDEAAKQEPVAWIARHKLDLPDDGNLHIYYIKSEADKWLNQYQPGFAWLEPLYRLPPNLPTIIEQTKRDEKNACAAIATAAKEHHDKYDIAAAIRARGAKK